MHYSISVGLLIPLESIVLYVKPIRCSIWFGILLSM